MSRFIESIKIEDQKAFLLDLHQKRVNQTFAHFGKEGSIDLAKIFKNLEHDEDGLYKLRIVYDLDKKFTTQLIPYAIPEIENFSWWKIILTIILSSSKIERSLNA